MIERAKDVILSSKYGLCPCCETEQYLRKVMRSETYTIKGRAVSVKAFVHVCRKCHGEFASTAEDEAAIHNLYQNHKRLCQEDSDIENNNWAVARGRKQAKG